MDGFVLLLAALLLSWLSGLPSGLLNELDAAVGTALGALTCARWSAGAGTTLQEFVYMLWS